MKKLSHEIFKMETVYITDEWDISNSSFDMCVVFIRGNPNIVSCYFESCLLAGALPAGCTNTFVNCK